MQFYFSINQMFLIKHGLNISEGAIYSYLLNLPSWAEKVIIENDVYYFASRNNIAKEMPSVSDKPDTIYRICKKLSDKNIISTIKIHNKDYVKINPEFSKEWHKPDVIPSEHSEKNPSQLGKKSEPTRKKIRTNSEKNPTYHNISNHTTNYHNTSDHNFAENKISAISIPDNENDFEREEIPEPQIISEELIIEQPKKEKRKKIAQKKEKAVDPLYKPYCEIWNELCLKYSGAPANWSFPQKNGVAINNLIKFFRSLAKSQGVEDETQHALYCFEYVSKHWEIVEPDKYLSNLDITMISKNISNIIKLIKQNSDHSVKRKDSYEKWALEQKKLDDLMNFKIDPNNW